MRTDALRCAAVAGGLVWLRGVLEQLDAVLRGEKRVRGRAGAEEGVKGAGGNAEGGLKQVDEIVCDPGQGVVVAAPDERAGLRNSGAYSVSALRKPGSAASGGHWFGPRRRQYGFEKSVVAPGAGW